METVKVFMNGTSEAVRLPENCQFGSSEVYVRKVGDMVLLLPKSKTWKAFIESLDGFSEDFMHEQHKDTLQKRAGF